MEVDRHIELVCTFKNRPELLAVKELAGGQSMNHRPLETVPGNNPFKLVGGSRRVAGGERPEGSKPVRLGFHKGGKPIVHAFDDGGSLFTSKLLCGWCAMRKHLDVDAGFVHLPQTHLAEIEKSVGDARGALD